MLNVCRSIMLAGHETTSKAVGTLSSFSNVVLTNSPADVCTLGVGQTPGFPGETSCGDQRDSGKSQSKR